MSDGTAIRDDIRRFVTDNFLFGDAGELPGDEDSFLENGVVDSTGVLELVGFLEERFGIHVEDEELVPDNLDSIERLVRFVESKLAEATA